MLVFSEGTHAKGLLQKENKDIEVKAMERDDGKNRRVPVSEVYYQFFSLLQLFGDTIACSVGSNTHFSRIAMISFAVCYSYGD